ncbi:MAG: UbiA family prenyltransferase [Candidatus Aenigmarchaeota archaeon]|nr:UbiA family prenyltransferase [Candidatus Aenigmarchaeota archaeon]
MNKLRALVLVSRPLGWVVVPLIFARGLLASGAELDVVSLVQAILLSFPASLFIYGVNDIYDYNSDVRNNRKGGVEGVILEAKNRRLVENASIFSAALLILSALVTSSYLNMAAMAGFLLLAYFYSTPPVRLKEKPPLDSVSNGLAYYFFPFLMGTSFGNVNITARIFFITFFVMGIHAFSTIMDFGADKKAGYKTFAVVFGKRYAALFSVIATAAVILFAGVGKITFFYMAACLAMYVIIFFKPSEKLASLFFKLILIGFLLTTINFFL